MPIDLDNPVDVDAHEWRRALEIMQGNILKGNGRDYSALLLIQFGHRADLRGRVGRFASTRITTASEQHRQAVRYREERDNRSGPDRQLFSSFFLSVWGYRVLGYNDAELSEAFPHPQGDSAAKSDPSSTNWFLHGMEYHGSELSDPPRLWWEPEYQRRIDAMLLLACDDLRELDSAVGTAGDAIEAFGSVLGIERGKTHRKGKLVLEPFGFADGISQPTFFRGERDQQRPYIVLHEDLLAGEPLALGSYLVYRKLEQNVKGLLEAEHKLAEDLGLTDKERAGAMIVGRFRDGSPLAKLSSPAGSYPPDNDFDYQDDKTGSKCPIHAHIRKVRPRAGDERRIVRRGVPYGSYDPTVPGMERPEKGSGLLFMSFQRNIRGQFGIVQGVWANQVDFPKTNTGQDPIAGQGWSIQGQRWPIQWGGSETRSHLLAHFVRLKGGEFFFAPSRPFFGRLTE